MTAYRTWREWEKEAPEGRKRTFDCHKVLWLWWAEAQEYADVAGGQVIRRSKVVENGLTRESACAALLERAKKPLIEVSER